MASEDEEDQDEDVLIASVRIVIMQLCLNIKLLKYMKILFSDPFLVYVLDNAMELSVLLLIKYFTN